MNFFQSLLSAEGAVSSKRFAGLVLTGFFVAGGIVAISTGTVSEVVESILKTSLYTGVGLLGVNAVADTIITTVKRPVPVVEAVKTKKV